MFVIGNFLIAVATIIGIILQLMSLLIFVRVVISWFSPDPYNPLVQFLHQMTEPILQPIRRRLPHLALDISPIIACIVLIFLSIFLVSSLSDLGESLRTKSRKQDYPVSFSSAGEPDDSGVLISR